MRGTRYPHKKQDFTKQRKTCEKRNETRRFSRYSLYTPPLPENGREQTEALQPSEHERLMKRRREKTKKNPKIHRKGKGDSVKTTQGRIPSGLTETVK